MKRAQGTVVEHAYTSRRTVPRSVVWWATLLALVASLLGATAAANAEECGCRDTGPYVAPRTTAPAAQESSPGGGRYRLSTSQTATEVTLRVVRASNGTLVEEFSLPLDRVAWGFSPDGDRFMYRSGEPGTHVDQIGLYDLAADASVFSTRATAGASVGFSPHGRWFLLNVLRGEGNAEIRIVDAASGETALSAPMQFESVPGDGGDSFGVIGGGFSSDADDSAFVWAYRQIGGGIELNLRNLADRTTVLSRPVGGSAFWRFSPCGDALGVASQSTQSSVEVSVHRTAVPELVGVARTFSPIPAVVRFESTIDRHQVVTTTASGHRTVTNIGPNHASTDCPTLPTVAQLDVAPSSVIGSQRNATATIRLSTPTPSSLVVTLSSSNPAAATVPATVTMLSGSQIATFPVSTRAVTAERSVVISATAGGVTRTATLTVAPPPVEPGPALASLSIDPLRVDGGTAASGTVTLAEPAGPDGATVELTSTHPGIASVPAVATVPADATTGSFTVETAAVVGDSPVVITASAGGISREERITVLSTDRECRSGVADPTTETMKARAFAAFDDTQENVDCASNAEIANGITVGAGTTGLAPGTPVQLVLTLRFDGSLFTSPSLGETGGAVADGFGAYSIVDDTPTGPEGVLLAVARFNAQFGLQQAPFDPSYNNVAWSSRTSLWTNASEEQSANDSGEFREPFGVALSEDTGTYTAVYTTTVGAHLTIRGRVSAVASAYGTGASAVADFSNTFRAATEPAPGFEGLELVYDDGGDLPPVDESPVCLDGSATTTEDVALAADLGCTDPEGQPLEYTVVTQPQHGALTGPAADGTFTYTPVAGYDGADSFTFQATDGTSASVVATFAVAVVDVNDTALCTDGAGETPAGVSFDGAVSCTDPDGDALAYVVDTGPAHGSLSAIAADGSFTYTPVAGYDGADSFTFHATDGTAESAVATFAVTVVDVNDPPVCIEGRATTTAGAAVSGAVSCTDPDGDPLAYAVDAGPAHGSLSAIAADGSFTYTPAAGFQGTDSFTYAAVDGRGGRATAQFLVEVQAPPAPVPGPGVVFGAGTIAVPGSSDRIALAPAVVVTNRGIIGVVAITRTGSTPRALVATSIASGGTWHSGTTRFATLAGTGSLRANGTTSRVSFEVTVADGATDRVWITVRRANGSVVSELTTGGAPPTGGQQLRSGGLTVVVG
jgi:hypothetical protein